MLLYAACVFPLCHGPMTYVVVRTRLVLKVCKVHHSWALFSQDYGTGCHDHCTFSVVLIDTLLMFSFHRWH